MNTAFKTLMLWLSLLTVVVVAWQLAKIPGRDVNWKFSEFMAQVDAGQVKDVTLTGNEIKGHTTAGETFHTYAPTRYEKLVDSLLAKKVLVTVQPAESPAWLGALVSAAPFVLLIGFWIFFMRQMQSGRNKAHSFGKSKAKLLASQQKKVTFKDVAGIDEAKDGEVLGGAFADVVARGHRGGIRAGPPTIRRPGYRHRRSRRR